MTANAYQNDPADLDAGQITTTNADVVRLPVEYRPRPDEAASKPVRGQRTRKPPKPKERKHRLKDLVGAHPKLNANAKFVGTKTCELFDLDEECAFPSNAWFKKKFGISPSTVRRAFVQLEAAELMHREINAAACGQNKIRPNWSKLDEPAKPASDDRQPQSGGTAPGSQERLPQAVRDGAPGQSRLTAVEGAETKLENQLEAQAHQMQDEGFADALPPARTGSFESEKRKPSGWDQPDWDEEWVVFQKEFNRKTGRACATGSEWKRAFCGVRKRGNTLDDIETALAYDLLVSNPHGAPRSMASFFAVHFGGERVPPQEVQHWRDGLAARKANPTGVQRPKQPVIAAVAAANAERRARQPAFATAPEAVSQRMPDDVDDEDDREERRQDRKNDRAEVKARTSWADWPLDDDVPF